MVQKLRLHTSNAWGPGSICSQGTKILHAAQHDQKKKEKIKIQKCCSILSDQDQFAILPFSGRYLHTFE